MVVSKEKSMIYHPEYKGVRLDVYANDEERTHYNVEMQVSKKPALGRRSRYYQSQIDMELLVSGEEYEELPDTYVIFLCDFDPFGQKKYRYTFSSECKECKESKLQDGRCTIFLSTHGENEDEVPKELVTFLRFVKAGLQESEQNFHDDYVEKLQRTIREIKRDREMEERFMILEEMLKDERKEGRAEGARLSLCTILECKGEMCIRDRCMIEREHTFMEHLKKKSGKTRGRFIAVSYTHLDVYKRQEQSCEDQRIQIKWKHQSDQVHKDRERFR